MICLVIWKMFLHWFEGFWRVLMGFDGFWWVLMGSLCSVCVLLSFIASLQTPRWTACSTLFFLPSESSKLTVLLRPKHWKPPPLSPLPLPVTCRIGRKTVDPMGLLYRLPHKKLPPRKPRWPLKCHSTCFYPRRGSRENPPPSAKRS